MSSKNEKVKYCKNCGEKLTGDCKKCPKCGASQSIPVWVIIVIVVAVILILALAFGSNDSDNGNSVGNENSVNSNSTPAPSNSPTATPQDDVYGFDETFVWDDLEITIGSNYSFTTVDNRYSDFNGQTTIQLPITVKNLSSETHSINMFMYTIYNSSGTEAEDVDSYFDDAVDFAGDLRSGSSYTKYLYFLYDGDGTYAIEFDNYSEKITVEFDIVKA